MDTIDEGKSNRHVAVTSKTGSHRALSSLALQLHPVPGCSYAFRLYCVIFARHPSVDRLSENPFEVHRSPFWVHYKICISETHTIV